MHIDTKTRETALDMS